MAKKLTKTQKIKQKMFTDGFSLLCVWLDNKGLELPASNFITTFLDIDEL